MSQCYDYSSETHLVGKLPTNIWLQCPSGNTCCITGSICLDHNLCHVPGSSSNSGSGSYSSYYVARCSDPTFTSPDCQRVCEAPGPPDAVYNYTSQQWNCCGKDAAGNVSCDDPTSEVFQAPAPADLKELSSGVVIVSTATLAAGEKTDTSTSTSASTSSSSSIEATSMSATQTSLSSSSTTTSIRTTPMDSTASSQPQETNSSLFTTQSPALLTTGAKAGIGIGVALAILILSSLVFFLLRRRRRSIAATTTITTHTESDVNGYAQPFTEKNSPNVVEKSADGDGERSELSSNNEVALGTSGGGKVHELGTSR